MCTTEDDEERCAVHFGSKKRPYGVWRSVATRLSGHMQTTFFEDVPTTTTFDMRSRCEMKASMLQCDMRRPTVRSGPDLRSYCSVEELKMSHSNQDYEATSEGPVILLLDDLKHGYSVIRMWVVLLTLISRA